MTSTQSDFFNLSFVSTLMIAKSSEVMDAMTLKVLIVFQRELHSLESDRLQHAHWLEVTVFMITMLHPPVDCKLPLCLMVYRFEWQQLMEERCSQF